jgi:iron complex outermembrane recepter protein
MLNRTAVARAVALVAGGLALASASGAWAQETQRVEITGSSIKRVDAETALPVTIMTRDQIEKSGATNVEDLLKRVSASTALVSDTTQGAGYATSNANLRGLGANSTLVLLNGRRLANHPFGSIGGNASVDLNSIPFAAIDRIEVLRDGASAVYGTDAVGGVINFITRRDYQKGEVTLRYGDTEKGIGGTEQGLSIAFGMGDLNTDRFNLLATFNYQKNSRLRAIDQQFYMRGLNEIPGSEPPTSGGGFPGRAVVVGAGTNITPGAYPELNPGSQFMACDPTFTVVSEGGDPSPNGTDARYCRFIYTATLDNLPDQEKGDLFARVTYNLSNDHQLFAEASYARNHNIGRVAPTPIFTGATRLNPAIGDYAHPMMPINSAFYPLDLLHSLGYTDAQIDPDGDGLAEVGLRAIPVGNRINDNTNTQARVVLGATGTLAGWDYNTALNVSQAKGALDYFGYVHEDRFLAALETGDINPFGPSGAAGEALWRSSLMEGPMRRSKSTTTEVDLRASRDLMAMGGGNMAMAWGVDFRREKAQDVPVNEDYSIGKHIGGEGSVPATQASRSIYAAFAELNLPFAKGWEAGIAARYDHYSDFGSTFNPRATIRFQPSPQLALRAAAGTGFRAPTLWDVNSPPATTNTANNLIDPDCPTSPAENDPRCNIQYNVHTFASSNLKPEKSKQFSLGVVFEPMRNLSATLDYWMITKRDQISVIGGDAILSDPALYAKYNSRIIRGADGYISYIETPAQNLGELRTSGLDIDLRGNMALGEGMRLAASIVGTYVNQWKQQTEKGGPFTSYVGTAGDGSAVQPVPRWQHTAAIDFGAGPWTVTLENVFVKGWTESAALVNNNVFVDTEHKVKDTSRFNASVSFKGIKDLTLRLGVRNLTDEEPPFTAVSSYGSHAAGYAASFADPRGRFWYGVVSYQFK